MALDLAQKQNLDLVAARQRRAVALAGERIARQRPNPSVGFAALRDAPHESLFFDQPIELGFKRRRRIDVARQEGVLTDVDIATLDRQVRRSVREAYYSVAFARAESARRGRVLDLTERLRQTAQARYEAGAVAQLEVVQAELEVSRAKADYQVAQQQEKVSLSQLNALLNEPAETLWELTGSLEDLPPATDLADLIRRAGGSNAELQRVRQEQKVEESRRALLKAERIPNLVLEAGTDFNAPGDFRVGPRGQLSVELPLFSRNQGEIAQSWAMQQVLQAQSAATQRFVAGQVEGAVEQAKANLENARLNSARNENLLQRGIAARKDLEDARTQVSVYEAILRQAEAALALARLQLSRTEVRSPLNGIVVKRLLSVGEQVDGTAAQPIFEVANTAQVELFGNVPAIYLEKMRPGQEFAISTDAAPGKKFMGRVVAISPAVDPSTNVGLVRIRISNQAGLLRLGMFLSAQAPLETHPDALVVPSQAVIVMTKGSRTSTAFAATRPRRFL